MLRAALVAGVLLAPASVSRAQDAFLVQLRRAVQADDRPAVAAMMQYPMTVHIAGLRVPFTDAAGVFERYDDIFTPALRESIARGSQDITVEMLNGQWRVTRITVPHGRPAENGEYRIEVRRMDNTDAAHLPYMLSLNLR